MTATGATMQSNIVGLAESCIKNVNLNNVSIQTSSLGMLLRHMTGTFTNVTSTPAPPNPPFMVQENVTVATAGTTPTITYTGPLNGRRSRAARRCRRHEREVDERGRVTLGRDERRRDAVA